MHCDNPLGQRRVRLLEDRSSPCRSLRATGRALEQPLGGKVALLPAPALRANEAVRPAHPHERSVILLLAALEPIELGHAEPLL